MIVGDALIGLDKGPFLYSLPVANRILSLTLTNHLFSMGGQRKINVLRSKHFGLMSGGELKWVFSVLAPLVSTGRLSSDSQRNQRLDANIHFIAEHFRKSFGRHMSLQYTKMLQNKTTMKHKLADVLERRIAERIDKAGKAHPAQTISIGYLQKQASKQI